MNKSYDFRIHQTNHMDFFVFFKPGEPLVIMYNCRSIEKIYVKLFKNSFSCIIFNLLLFHPEQIKRKENCGSLAAMTHDKMFVTAFAHKYSVMVMQPYTNMSKMGPIFNFVIGYGVTFSGVLLYNSLDSNLLQH